MVNQWHIEGDERTYSKPEILEQYTRDYLAGELDEGEMWAVNEYGLLPAFEAFLFDAVCRYGTIYK